MSNLMELREKQQKILKDATDALDRVETAENETRAKEIETEYDSLMSEHDKIVARAERAQKLADAQRAISDSPAPVTPEKKQDAGAVRSYRELYVEYLRSGISGLSDADRKEFRAQSAGVNSEGGFTVDSAFFAELNKSMKAFGPMLDPGVTRQIVTGTGANLEWPTMDDTSNKGALLAENTQDSASNLVFAQKQLDAFKYTSGIFRVSEELLQDSELDIEGIVRDAMAERIGRIANEHLTTGTGSGQPNGILTATTSGVTADSATLLDADELLDLFHSVDPAYRQLGSAWMWNDTTLKAIRKLKDGQGNYLWQAPDLRTGEPGTFLGSPYVINQDMPGIEASSTPVLFGNMDRYVVRRVKEFAIKRLVERYADFYQVGFVGFTRLDGELIDAGSTRKLTMGAT